jgi:hypothetical protein
MSYGTHATMQTGAISVSIEEFATQTGYHYWEQDTTDTGLIQSKLD